MKKLLPFIWVVTVIALTFNGCSTGFERDEYGSIISGGTIKAGSLRIGDCFNDLNPEEIKELAESVLEDGKSETVDIIYVSAVPCNMPHNNEVFAQSASLFSVLDDDYPSDKELGTRTENFCVPEAHRYLGIDTNLSQSKKERMFTDAFPNWYQYLFPTPRLWDTGNRQIHCIFYTELARENSARNLLEKRY